MQSFRVDLTATAFVSSVVRVEAENETEAITQAIRYAEDGNALWEYEGVCDSTIEVSGAYPDVT